MQRKLMIALMALSAALSTAALAVATGWAQPRSPKPYPIVAIAPQPPSDDKSFADFRAAFAHAAKSRVYAELAALVRPVNFFWERDFDNRFDPRKPAVDNLAAAVRLEHDDGVGWRLLAAYAGEAAIEPLVSRPGVFCTPARPRYDGIEFAKLLRATYSTEADWVYPRAEKTPLLAAPEPRAALVATLGMHFTRLHDSDDTAGFSVAGFGSWSRVSTPDAKIGFVAPGRMLALDAERLCYFKDVIGRWRIAGYIGGPN